LSLTLWFVIGGNHPADPTSTDVDSVSESPSLSETVTLWDRLHPGAAKECKAVDVWVVDPFAPTVPM
jgi:hypothetical protein